MGQEFASNDHNLKPAQSDDDDSDFPEFEFPVGDAGDEDASSPSMTGFSSNQSVDVSPQKMPLAFLRDENTEPLLAGVTARLTEESNLPEEEIKKHVVVEEATKTSSALLQGPQRKVLQSNPSFKSLVNTFRERTASPTRFKTPNLYPKYQENGEAPGDAGDTVLEQGKVLATPLGKRLSLVSRATQSQTDRTPERARQESNRLSVNALMEKFSRNKLLEEAARALSSSPTPRNLSSPRRKYADSSSASLTLHDHGKSGDNRAPYPSRSFSSPRHSSMSGSISERSLSPPRRSWKDSVYGDMPKDKRPNFSTPTPTAPPPRFLSSTRAAALKAVKPPATPNHSSSKRSSHIAFGITTPVKDLPEKAPRDHKAPKPNHAKATPTLTEPAGFNFRTSERAQRRKDYYSKLEERLKVKEIAMKQQEAKMQEEKELQLRELRKTLTYKANPVPRFYQEPALAPAPIRKQAPTRAKSPNFSAPRRRESCPGNAVSETSSNSTTSVRSSCRLLRCSAFLESNSGHFGHYVHSKATPKPQYQTSS